MYNVPERYNASILLDSNIEAGHSNKVAFYFADTRMTYGELFSQTCRMGSALLELSVQREHRVLLVLSDTPNYPIAFLGALRIGAVPVPVNPLFKGEDYRYIVEDLNIQVIITDEPFLDKITTALIGYSKKIVLVSTGPVRAGIYSMSELLAAQNNYLPLTLTHRDDIAFLLYSGGSTGRPKGVVHLHHDILFTCETYARNVLKINTDDIVFGRALYHAYGLGAAITFPLWAGASSILCSHKPTPKTLLDTIVHFRPTVLFLVPTLYNTILNDPAAVQYKLDSLRLCISAAEPLPPETWRRWKETFGVTILDGIGSTEMLHIFCSNTIEELCPGSSGKPVPGYELRIVNADASITRHGEAGELAVKGDSAAPFYWHQHAKSMQTMRGEWVMTGDRYHIDNEGFYWYEGRTDDMIRVGGEWVSPIEIENTLLENACVKEAAVVGVPIDGIMRIKAVITLLPDLTTSRAELVVQLQEWCKAKLERYQYPHLIDFVEELPKTTTGKIQRYQLRKV
jgi:benzoate-CoA ligase family protein